MNIWLINQYAIPPSQSGGTRHYSIASELIRCGHKVTIVASSFDHVSRRELRLQPGQDHLLETIAGVPFLWLRTPPYSGNTFARMKNMVMFAKQAWLGAALRKLPKPDLVIGSSPHLFGAWAAMRQALRHRVPFVLEVRDLWPESLIQIGNYSRNHPLMLVLAWIEKSLYRHAAQIWTLLPTAGDHMVQKGAAREKIRWFPNGVDLNLIPPPAPRPPGDTLKLLYAGTISVLYGLDYLLDVAKALQKLPLPKPCVLHLVGDGPEKARLQARVKDENIRNVVIENAVPKAEVFAKMADADLLIAILRDLPLYQHGISLNKVYDYMAAARPVLFSVKSSNNPCWRRTPV